MHLTTSDRYQRALDSLQGLSVGDAFGQQFFMSWDLSVRLMESGEFGGPPFDFQDEFVLRELIAKRDLRWVDATWSWTDDTAMAISVVANLWTYEAIKPDNLAMSFSLNYARNSNRVYGAAMHDLLPLLAGGDYEIEAAKLFDGAGSWGNGAAPIGAFFADDVEACIGNAELSARVTHAHPEAITGAVAVALAASFASNGARDLLSEVAPLLAPSEVRTRCEKARELTDVSSIEAAAILGNGSGIAAHDTVPFCLWCATHFGEKFEQAMWQTVAGLGDRDTTCAIVGGILGERGIPANWRAARESLETF